jgi:hypothetical protein
MNRGYVFSHEHDFIRSFRPIETEQAKKLLICTICDVSYCEWCGKEVTAAPIKMYTHSDIQHTLNKIGEFGLR